MTIKQIIDMVDEIYPNEFDFDKKIVWLDQLESELFETVFSLYDFPGSDSFDGYDSETPDSTEPLAPKMFHDIYLQFLLMKIYQAREETVKYNNTVEVFNTLLFDLRSYMSRTFKRKATNRFKNYKG